MKILFFTLITIPFLIACSKPEYKNEHKINYKTIKNLSCQNRKATGILQLDTLKLDGKESSMEGEDVYKRQPVPVLFITISVKHSIRSFLSKIKAGESTHTTSVNSMSVPSTSSTMSVKESKWPRSIICPKVLSTLSVPITEKAR